MKKMKTMVHHSGSGSSRWKDASPVCGMNCQTQRRKCDGLDPGSVTCSEREAPWTKTATTAFSSTVQEPLVWTQNTSPSSARTTSGKKNEMMSLKTWSVQHILQTPSSWFGMNWTEEVQSIPEMNWSTGPAKQFTSATHLWELQQQIWEELSEEYLISNLSCYICQRRVLCWVKRLEYISVCKLIPCFYF